MSSENSAPDAEPTKLELEYRRFALEEKRLALDSAKQAYDQRFTNRYLAIFVTAAISLSGVLISIVARNQALREAQIQKVTAGDLETRRQLQDWKVQFMRLFLEHRQEIICGDQQVLAVISVGFPDAVAAEMLKRLKREYGTAGSAACATGATGATGVGTTGAGANSINGTGAKAHNEDRRPTVATRIETAELGSQQNIKLNVVFALESIADTVMVDATKEPPQYIPRNLFEMRFTDLGLSDSEMPILKARLSQLLPSMESDIDKIPNNANSPISKVEALLERSALINAK